MKSKTVEEAAGEVGVSVTCWRFWERGMKVPSPINMSELYKWSGGFVVPNDFYDLPQVDNDGCSVPNGCDLNGGGAIGPCCSAAPVRQDYAVQLDVLPGQQDFFAEVQT